MDFVSNQDPQIQEMLKAIGVNNIEELFAAIPAQLKQAKPSQDDGLSEFEGLLLMQELSEKNTFQKMDNYLGAGAYEHHVPALVSAVTSKSEFLTSYTPYQAEASQGMLQIIFEFQSAICALTGMDVSNASLYDGASACAEAVLMALRLQKNRNKILIAGSLHPNYRKVVDLYLSSHDCQVETIPYTHNGQLDTSAFLHLIDSDIAAVLIQSPNFFGCMEDILPLSAKIKEVNSLLILCSNPLSFGIYAMAGELGADIAVGDCQPFGLPLNFGGPYVGYMACKQDYVRQMPGRIVGETNDTEGNRGFVLTLQAREQHIRREKATSNICTNQALAALASLVAMLWYGKKGIRELALMNFQKASYLKDKLKQLQNSKFFGEAPFFNEFLVNLGKPSEEVQHHFRKNGIEPGLDIGKLFPKLQNFLLVSVTETKSKEQLDRYVHVASELK